MSKEKIFALLSAQAGDFVSGEDISAQLGISRAAVWKAVGALRRDGYTIEAQTGLGYRLADSPDVLSERELRRRLGETKTVGRTLHCFESVDSTNSYLKRIAAEGAPDGAVAVADEQTAGRGRRGRSFSSSPGRGVYLSALLRPQLAPEKILPLTALGAVAACDAVERTCGVRPQSKWTNDLVLNGKKLSGTLTELSLEGESGALQYAVIGIGVNIAPLPGEGFATPPAWLQELLPGIDAPATLARIAAPLVQTVRGFEQGGFAPLAERFAARDLLAGQAVRLSDGTEGVAQGVGPGGELRVHTPAGLREVHSAEVSVRPQAPQGGG